jgi:hypothetical protein
LATTSLGFTDSSAFVLKEFESQLVKKREMFFFFRTVRQPTAEPDNFFDLIEL